MPKADYFIHETSILDDKVEIGNGTKIWHFCHISENSIIGQDCIIGQNVFIGKNVKIGNGVKIQNNVCLFDGVEVEEDVFIGPSVVFTNVLNPRAFIENKHQFLKTVVKKGASIGANCTIICGNTIGEFALIGAGSVVTKSIQDFELWYGNPAKKRGMVNQSGKIIKG